MGSGAGTLAIGPASSISPRKRLDHFIRLVLALAREGQRVRGYIAGRPTSRRMSANSGV